jgi:hypothetical protein
MAKVQESVTCVDDLGQGGDKVENEQEPAKSFIRSCPEWKLQPKVLPYQLVERGQTVLRYRSFWVATSQQPLVPVV